MRVPGLSAVLSPCEPCKWTNRLPAWRAEIHLVKTILGFILILLMSFIRSSLVWIVAACVRCMCALFVCFQLKSSNRRTQKHTHTHNTYASFNVDNNSMNTTCICALPSNERYVRIAQINAIQRCFWRFSPKQAKHMHRVHFHNQFRHTFIFFPLFSFLSFHYASLLPNVAAASHSAVRK